MKVSLVRIAPCGSVSWPSNYTNEAHAHCVHNQLSFPTKIVPYGLEINILFHSRHESQFRWASIKEVFTNSMLINMKSHEQNDN